LMQENESLDLYGVLRLPNEDIVFSEDKLKQILNQLQQELFKMRDQDRIKLSEVIEKDIEAILKDGIKRLGSYHANLPLKINKKGEIISQSFPLLYYYHNRLTNYGLEKCVQWEELLGRPSAQLIEHDA
ncbi:MAG: hypothetical protein AAF599_05915, partial [Bacteroidota bacterium]